MLIGINGIETPNDRLQAQISALAGMMRERGVDVCLASVLPLRNPDAWNRFQYQDKIVTLNGMIADWAKANGCVFLDYHSALKDETGQLAAEYARPDGTHLRFAAYEVMSEIVAPFLR